MIQFNCVLLVGSTAKNINAELFLYSFGGVFDFPQLCRRQVLLEALSYLETG